MCAKTIKQKLCIIFWTFWNELFRSIKLLFYTLYQCYIYSTEAKYALPSLGVCYIGSHKCGCIFICTSCCHNFLFLFFHFLAYKAVFHTHTLCITTKWWYSKKPFLLRHSRGKMPFSQQTSAGICMGVWSVMKEMVWGSRTRPLTFPLIVGLYELWRLFIVRQIFDQDCQCCCCCHTIDDCVSLSKPSKTGWFLSPFCYILSKIIVVAFLNTFLTMVFPECHSIWG